MGVERPGGAGEPGPGACPRCARDLVREATQSGERERAKEWWRCPGCGFLGRPDLGGRPVLHPFRELTGDDADFVFCGWEDCNRAGEAFAWNSRLCEWIVCTACGRENVRRIKRVSP